LAQNRAKVVQPVEHARGQIVSGDVGFIRRRIDSNLQQVITAILHVLKCWSSPLFALALVVFFAADVAP
jgi:hypothetical protein